MFYSEIMSDSELNKCLENAQHNLARIKRNIRNGKNKKALPEKWVKIIRDIRSILSKRH